MGLLNGNTRPKEDIDKNAPQKKGIFRFFEIFFRKLWKLLTLNILTFFLSLPFIFIMFLISPLNSDEIKGIEAVFYDFQLRTFFAVTAFSLLGSGGASVGYAYIARCFTKEEPCWLFIDFFKRFKENFKKSLLLSVLDIALSLLFVNSISFYYMQYVATANLFYLAGGAFSLLMYLMLIFMNFYTYQFMVTFSSGTIELFKNSFMFALANLPMNIFLLVLALLINVAVFSLNTPISFVLSFIITVSLVRFPIEYTSGRAIEKKLIDNTKPKSKKGER